MSQASRGYRRLCELYRTVYARMRALNARLADPRACRALAEPLEGRVLLSAYVVNSLADTIASDGVVTLREALEASNTNTAVTADVSAGSATQADTITFDLPALQAQAGPGNPLVITLGGTELQITGDLRLTGHSGLKIDAGNSSRVFRIVNPDAAVVLESLTLVNGRVVGNSRGGGIENAGDLTLNRVWIQDCFGGGIHNQAGRLTMTYSGVLRNSGEGIRNETGAVELTNVRMEENTGTQRPSGSAIYMAGGTLVLRSTTIRNNHLGGVVSYADSVTVEDSTISESGGPGLACHGGTLTVANATILDSDDDALSLDGVSATLTDVHIRGGHDRLTIVGGQATLTRVRTGGWSTAAKWQRPSCRCSAAGGWSMRGTCSSTGCASPPTPPVA